MTAHVQHHGRVTQEGELRLRDVPGWNRAIRRHKGHDIVLTIRRVGAEKPTHEQHGYYRSTILPLLAEEWGWSDQAELHFRLKEKHLPAIVPLEQWPFRKVGNLAMREPPSMAELTVEQASAFMQAVIDHATEEGISIPPPRGKVA